MPDYARSFPAWQAHKHLESASTNNSSKQNDALSTEYRGAEQEMRALNQRGTDDEQRVRGLR